MINHSKKDAKIPGIATAIIRDGKSLYIDSAGTDGKGNQLTNNSPVFIGSLSKSLTALATMQLVEKGLISLDDPVKKHIPYFQVANPNLTENITVENLLQQRSGLSRKKEVPSSDYDFSIKERVKALSDMEEVTQNGKEFYYLNDNYNILGLLIEEVSGQSYADYMKDNVFQPIGMTATTADIDRIRSQKIAGYTNIFGFNKSIDVSVPRYDIPSGYILSTIEDMNKYMAFLLDPDEDVLPREIVNEMRKAPENSDYGMGWHINKTDNLTVVEHSGAVPGFSSHMALIPETNSGYVYIMNKGHLIFNFVKVFDKLNANLMKVLKGESSFEFFPSNWIILIISLLLIILTAKDVLTTKNLLSASKEKKGWIKEVVKSLLLIVFLTFGLSFILKDILGLGYDLRTMFSYAPDFTFLLGVAILVQVVRGLSSIYFIFRRTG